MDNKSNYQPKSGLSLTLQLSNPNSNALQRSITSGSKERPSRTISALNSSFGTYAANTSGGGYGNQYPQNQGSHEHLFVSQDSLENIPTKKMIPGYIPQSSFGSSQEIKQNNLDELYNINEQEPDDERNVVLSKSPRQHYSRYNSKSEEVTLNNSMISISSKSYALSDHYLEDGLIKRASNNSNSSAKIISGPTDIGKVTVRDLSYDLGTARIGELELSQMEQESKELLEIRIKNGEQDSLTAAELYLKLADISIRSIKKMNEAPDYIEKAWAVCTKIHQKQDVIPICQQMASILIRASRVKIDLSKYRAKVLNLLSEKISSVNETERAEILISLSSSDYKEHNKGESLAVLVNGLRILKKTLGENHLTYKERVLSVQSMIFEKRTDFVLLRQDDEVKPFLEESPKYFEKTPPNHVICLLNLAKLYKDMQLSRKSLETYLKAKEICATQQEISGLYDKDINANIISLKKQVQKHDEVDKTKRKVELDKYNFSQRISEESSFFSKGHYGEDNDL